MKKVAIQDANILIDLLKADLFAHCLLLDFEFCTTDIILAELYEEQRAFLQAHINAEKFIVIAISEEDLSQISLLSVTDSRLSEQDWSAYFYAQQQDALLLTGDRRLKKYATDNGITAYGVLWIFDQLVTTEHLSKNEACTALQQMMAKNKRLPIEECELRLKEWCR